MRRRLTSLGPSQHGKKEKVWKSGKGNCAGEFSFVRKKEKSRGGACRHLTPTASPLLDHGKGRVKKDSELCSPKARGELIMFEKKNSPTSERESHCKTIIPNKIGGGRGEAKPTILPSH